MCLKTFLYSCKFLNLSSELNVYTKLIKRQIHYSSILWAGHSKWANIKHTKAEKDGQRAAIFSRLTRQIRMAVQEGGSADPATNTALRNVVDIALKKNMPMSTIQTTIKKIDINKSRIKEFLLEMKAWNKIYMIGVVYTDNLSTFKMNLAAPVLKKAKASFFDCQHLFEDIGIIEAIAIHSSNNNLNLEDFCTSDAIEVGAEEVEIVESENNLVNFMCNPQDLLRISKLLSEKGYQIQNAERAFIPKAAITISDAEFKQYEILREKLLALDGLERLYDNLNYNTER